MAKTDKNKANAKLYREFNGHERKRIDKIHSLKEELLIKRSLNEKLKIITEGIKNIFNADFARIWLVKKGDICEKGCFHATEKEGPHVCRDRSRCLHLMASSGRYTNIDGSHKRVPLGSYKIGRVASGEDPYFITNDVTHDQRVHDHKWAKTLGLVSFGGFRLLSAERKPIGVLALFSKHEIVYSEEGLLQDIANTTSQVILAGLAEEALQESEEKYHTVADFTYDWEDWLDSSGKYIYISPSCEWITGYHRDEFLDMDMVLKITHPDDRELLKKHFHEALSGSIEILHIDFRIITRSGDERWISQYCQPVYNKDGTFLGTRGSSRDITELKQTEQKLKQLTDGLNRYNVELQSVNDRLKAEIEVRERMQKALELSEERYKKMVDAVTSYTYSVQVRKGNAIYTEHSKGCLPITGYNPEDYRYNPHLWHSMIYPDDKMAVENTIKEIMAGHKILPIEHRIIRRDGTIIWIRNTIVPYYNDDEELVQYEGLIENITERKLAEEEIQKLNKELEQKLLELTEANKDLEAFNRTVSHDLQTPLMVIGGFARRFLKAYGDTLDAEAIDTIQTIQMSAQKMERLIKDILAFSRSGRQEIKPVEIDMGKLVSTLLEELNPLFERRVINFEIKALSPAYGDISLIKQVFVNLISNAVKFTSTNEMAIVEIGCRLEESENIYYVKDNGIGFDSQHADKLFAPFNRLPEAKEFEGTGIGLSIVERIINRHGGRVWAESKVNEGATFYFSLPNQVD